MTDLFKKSFNFDQESLDLDDVLAQKIWVESFVSGRKSGHGRKTGVGGLWLVAGIIHHEQTLKESFQVLFLAHAGGAGALLVLVQLQFKISFEEFFA